MKEKRIAIIGGGNLGTAIAEGLLISGEVQPSQLHVTRRRTELLKGLADRGVAVGTDNSMAVRESDIIIMAVKPYQVIDILKGFQPELTNQKVLISLVAGVDLKELTSVVGPEVPLFRAMPNTAIALQESMTLVSTNGSDMHTRNWSWTCSTRWAKQPLFPMN